ncbi:MAG: hypothetical protein J0M17_22895 [Planctomycetes bacterium]|nr:hypothetical protein [Planctomycetota bacterium]
MTPYRPPDYDDELTPEMREQVAAFCALFEVALERLRGETPRLVVLALLDAVAEASTIEALAATAGEELSIELQCRYHDALGKDGDGGLPAASK